MSDEKSLIKTFVSSFVSGVLLLGTRASNSAHADNPPPLPKAWEKCYAVARAGFNDCSSLDGRHGCAGAAESDSDANEYIWVPKGTCQKIVNGTLISDKAVKARKKCVKFERRKK